MDRKTNAIDEVIENASQCIEQKGNNQSPALLLGSILDFELSRYSWQSAFATSHRHDTILKF